MPILPGLIANSGGSQPTPPINLIISSGTTNSFLLNWTAPTFLGKIDPLRYVISLYDSSGSLINASYRTVNHPATSLTIDGLSEGTTYSVRMRLENSVGIFSDLSVSSGNVTTAVTPPPPPPPDPGEPCPAAGTELSRTGCIANYIYITLADGNCGSTQTSQYCGAGAPSEPTCTASCGSYSAWGGCTSIGAGGGVQYRTRTCTRTDCTTFTQTDSRNCCSQQCGSWSNWVGDSFGQTRSRTCQRSDCTTYTETEQRCQSFTTTSCGSCSRTRPFRRTCTTTVGRTDCTTSSTTSTQSC